MPRGTELATHLASTVRIYGKRLVNMNGIGIAAFVFLVGITVSGLLGSVMEIVTGRTLGFVEPYVSRGHVARSLLAAMVVGPMMLVNDALSAWREGRVGVHWLAVAAVIASVWCQATGIVVTEIAVRMSERLG